MAEVIQCPHCLIWLNMEMHEAVLKGTFGDTLLYRCQKCGAFLRRTGKFWSKGRPDGE